MQHLYRPQLLRYRPMDCSALTRTLRSTTVGAFLGHAVIGCGNGNAQAGAAVIAADSTVQDWETQPPLWVPRPILIERANPPVAASDTSPDSTRTDSTRNDSLGPQL